MANNVRKVNLGRVKGDVDANTIIEFDIPEEYTEIRSGDRINTILGKIAKGFKKQNEKWDDISTVLLDKIFPIGSIYMSVNNVSPESFLGGEWRRWAKGFTLVGVNEDDPDFNEAGMVGGEKMHRLTYDEMPSHGHIVSDSFGLYQEYRQGEVISGNQVLLKNNVASNPRILHAQASGGGQPHNNLQPYLTCYIWKRIA